MDLVITEDDRDGVVVVTLTGDIDVTSSPQLRDCLDRHILQRHLRLVIDLEGVTFMDSTALGILVGRLRLMRMKQGTMRLVCTVPRLLRIFGITGLDKVFAVHAGLDDAIAATRGASASG